MLKFKQNIKNIGNSPLLNSNKPMPNMIVANIKKVSTQNGIYPIPPSPKYGRKKAIFTADGKLCTNPAKSGVNLGTCTIVFPCNCINSHCLSATYFGISIEANKNLLVKNKARLKIFTPKKNFKENFGYIMLNIQLKNAGKNANKIFVRNNNSNNRKNNIGMDKIYFLPITNRSV